MHVLAPFHLTSYVSADESITVLHANDNMQNSSTQFNGFESDYLYAVLSYHQISGSWGIQNLGQNHTILQTALSGQGISYLENNIPQVIVATADSGEIEIQNQVVTTKADPAAVLNYQEFTIQILNEVIGFPPAYSYFASNYGGLDLFHSLVSSAGGGALDDLAGVTIFAPYDEAGGWHNSGLNSTQPSNLVGNHVSSFLHVRLEHSDLTDT